MAIKTLPRIRTGEPQLRMHASSIHEPSVSLRVLLVYSNRIRILEPTPPIGLSYVATATRAAGHEVRFLDLMVSRDPELRDCG